MKMLFDIFAGFGMAVIVSLLFAYLTGNLKYNITINDTVYKNVEKCNDNK